MMTSLRFFTEYMTALTIVLSPGITATDFKARKTRNTLKAEKLPCKKCCILSRLTFITFSYISHQVDGQGDIWHKYDHEIQPVPSISQIWKTVEYESPGEDFNRGFIGINCSENDLRRRSISEKWKMIVYNPDILKSNIGLASRLTSNKVYWFDWNSIRIMIILFGYE